MKVFRSALRGLGCLLLCSSAAFAAEPPANRTVTLNIASQPVDQALNAFAQQTGLQLLFRADAIAEGMTAPRLVGTFTTRAALSQLLANTPLDYEFLDESTVTIRMGRSTSSSDSQRTSDDRQAVRTQFVPVRMAQVSSTDRTEAPQTPAKQEEERASGNTVTVTGSRLKRKTEEAGPAPVISIDREEIERRGYSSIRELINTLPQAAVQNDESGNNTFAGASTIQLRGLSLGSTLVLLNGRPLSPSAAQVSRNFFDLNNIPLEAVERIEILTDTASAIYGADASGGAVNFILRKNFNGIVGSARYGISGQGDAEEKGATLIFGGSTDIFSGSMVIDYFDRGLLVGADRELTRDSDFRRFGGVDGRSTSTFPANVYALPGTGNLPGLSSNFAASPRGTNGVGLTPANFTAGVLNRDELSPFASLLAPSERVGLLGNMRYKASDRVDLFSELLVTRNDQNTQLAPDPLTGAAAGQFVVPANNPFNPFGVPVAVDYRFNEMGPRIVDTSTDMSRALVGAEGSIGDSGIGWQLTLLSDRDATIIRQRNFVNRDRVRTYLNSTNPATALNPFSDSYTTPAATLAAIRDDTTQDTRINGRTIEGSLNGSFDVLDRSIAWSLGALNRWQEVGIHFTSSSIEGSRDLVAGYAELGVPIIQGAHRLELSLAGRYDEYSDFGGDFNPQAGIVYQPIPSLLLRGSVGTGFKAPSLYDLNSPRTQSTSNITDPLRNNEAVLIDFFSGSNPNIEPEHATSYTFGFIVEPSAIRGLSIGVSAFHVKQEDFITRFFDTQLLLRNPQLFSNRIVRAAQTPGDIAAGLPGRLLSVDLSTLNFGQLIVEGVDLDAAYTFEPTSLGRFRLSANTSYLDRYEIQLTPAAPPENMVGKANRAGYPSRFKGNVGLNWSGERGLSANLLARYIASYTDYDNIRTLPAQCLFDLQLAFDFSRGTHASWAKGLSGSLSIINLTDNQGDFANTFTGYDFQQADLRGRYFNLRLKHSF